MYFSRGYTVIACWVLVGLALGLEDGPDRPVIGAPGAPVRLSDSDPGVMKAVKFAEERYNMGSNAMHVRRVSKILSASKQVTLNKHNPLEFPINVISMDLKPRMLFFRYV